jgi:hypothetical protein
MDITKYESLRDQMLTGDSMVFAGTGWISRIIQARTKSPYSHVAMILRTKLGMTERVFLCHATAEFGVHLVPVSRYLAQHQGRAWWVPVNPQAVTTLPSYQDRLVDVAAQDLGRKYDFRGIGQFLAPKLWQQNDARRFCSETNAFWWNAVGVLQDTFVSPGQFIAQPLFHPPVSLV